MPKLTLSDVQDIRRNTAATTINSNSALIETALDNTLSRDGTLPNQMEADLDMNSNRILNLPQPNSDTEPLRKVDIEVFDDALTIIDNLDQINGLRDETEIFRNETEVFKDATLAASVAIFADREALESSTISSSIGKVYLKFFDIDHIEAGGGAWYDRLTNVPITPNLRHVLSDGGTKAWTISPFQDVTPNMFGARGDDSTDDSEAVQEWLNFGQDEGCELVLPPFTYRCLTQLEATRALRIRGHGEYVSVLKVDAGVITCGLLITLEGINEGTSLRNFSLVPVTEDAGLAGIKVLRPNANTQFFNFVFDSLHVGKFAQTIRLDNSILEPEGIYLGLINRCTLEGGLYGYGLGDSITIQDGRHHNSTAIGVYATSLPGCTQFTLQRMNITTRGGAVLLQNMVQPRILYNQLEHGWWFGLQGAGLGDYTNPSNVGAHVFLNSCTDAILHGNTISPMVNIEYPAESGDFYNTDGADYSIYLVGCRNVKVTDNLIAKGKLAHIANLDSISSTLSPNNNNDTPYLTSDLVIIEGGSSSGTIIKGDAYFSAHKNGTDQTGLADATFVKVTFTNSERNLGTHIVGDAILNRYDSVNSRWYPPRGPISIKAAVRFSTGTTSGGFVYTALYKNGILYKIGHLSNTSESAPATAMIDVEDVCDGDDYYEIYAYTTGTGTRTISGSATETWFQGSTK